MLGSITRLDVWLLVLLAAAGLLGALFAHISKWPSPDTVQTYATIANTPGGIVIILVVLWLFTLTLTTAICLWVIAKGIDPQNGTLVMLTGMLSSGAFGAVNGALFTSITGKEPKPPAGIASVVTTTEETKSQVVAPAAQSAAPIAPPKPQGLP
jgi:hypothetical protein